MAVTRSSSTKKVVCKAVAVKVTKSSGRKYVSWDDSCNQLIAFWKKEGQLPSFQHHARRMVYQAATKIPGQ